MTGPPSSDTTGRINQQRFKETIKEILQLVSEPPAWLTACFFQPPHTLPLPQTRPDNNNEHKCWEKGAVFLNPALSH